MKLFQISLTFLSGKFLIPPAQRNIHVNKIPVQTTARSSFYCRSLEDMENYRKGKNVEEELTKEKIPIPDLPNNFIWMQVHGGSKIRNLLDVALKGFVDQGAVVWTGSGAAISKTISCAEILKRKHKAHQITKISYRKYEEFWEPLLDELDELVVVRDEPIIHILLSKEPLNTQELGYQAPGEIDSSFKVVYEKPNSKPAGNKNRNKPYTSNSEQRSQPFRSQRQGQHKRPQT